MFNRGSRSPHGERGLKCIVKVFDRVLSGRSPHGERGLKLFAVLMIAASAESLSSWRAWIEIGRANHGRLLFLVALLMESVD